MRLSHLFRLLMLGAGVILMSCTRDVEDIDFDVTSKLVVTSFISPQDTVLVVHLQRSQPAIGKKLTEEQLKVKDANVVIYDVHSGSSVSLVYNPELNHYEANAKVWPIVAGKTYKLVVSRPSGDKAEATCTVPLVTGIGITEINAPLTIVKDYAGSSVRKYVVSFKWQDAPDVKNYYRTLAYKEYKVKDFYGFEQVYREGLNMSYNGSDLQQDAKNSGGTFTSEPLAFLEYNYDVILKPFYVHAVLVISDEHYYQYHQLLYKQSESGGNPFAEPAIMYTNISGGLGVFAGYNQLVISKALE